MSNQRVYVMARKKPDEWFDEYGESHQNHLNKLLHWVCVPAITASSLARMVAAALEQGRFQSQNPLLLG